MTVRTPPFRRLAPPAELALSVAEAKEHLRIRFADDDAWLAAAIEAAVAAFEQMAGKPLISGDLVAAAHAFPSGSLPFYLPLAGITAAVSITYRMPEHASPVVLDPATWRLDARPLYAYLHPAAGQAWPLFVDQVEDAVTLTVTAGYPDAASVPHLTRMHLKAAVAELYYQREMTQDGPAAPSLAAALQALDGAMARLA